MIVAIVGILLFIALAIAPQLWVKRVLKRHSRPRPWLPGTGGEFARHLLDGMKLGYVKVEETATGDHYDPKDKAVRLTTDKFHGKSLTAIVVAAHEVGHAMQDATDYGPLKARTRWVSNVSTIQTTAVIVLVASLGIGIVLRHPIVPFIGIGAAVILNASIVLMHFATLPVEFDASFKRALPVLRDGGYLKDRDLAAARNILSAAAYTYVAAALISIIYMLRFL